MQILGICSKQKTKYSLLNRFGFLLIGGALIVIENEFLQDISSFNSCNTCCNADLPFILKSQSPNIGPHLGEPQIE